MAEKYTSTNDLLEWACSLPNLELHRNMASILEAKNIKSNKARAWVLDSQTNLNQVAKELRELNG